MINQCISCKFHETSNKNMRAYGKLEIDADYCLRYRWNLTGMTKIPENCYQRRC